LRKKVENRTNPLRSPVREWEKVENRSRITVWYVESSRTSEGLRIASENVSDEVKGIFRVFISRVRKEKRERDVNVEIWRLNECVF
jgi:hypothetical protein